MQLDEEITNIRAKIVQSNSDIKQLSTHLTNYKKWRQNLKAQLKWLEQKKLTRRG